MKVIISIDVPELRPAVASHTAALGLEHTRTLDDDVAELIGVTATIYLLQKESGTRAVRRTKVDRDYGRHWIPVHFDLVVLDRMKLANALTSTPSSSGSGTAS